MGINLSRLSKLRAMSGREVAHRVGYKLALWSERKRYERGTLAGAGRLERALRNDLRGAQWKSRLIDARRQSTARYLPGTRDRDRMRELFDARYRAELQDTWLHAGRARDRQFEFFGLEFDYKAGIDWQTDPVTGRAWPPRYHADVPIHGGDVGFGDVKHVWELSRQQYLIDLGKAFFLRGDRSDLDAIRDLVRSWRAGNSYATGINWACALEPAFRVLSWLWAYHLTADALDDDFHAEWLEGFYDHGRFLATHLEHYSSPYNHLIGEAAALYSVGLCFPEFSESAAWRKKGRAVLESRLAEQFYADGGSVEQSTFYHHATVGFYLLAALTARANGEELSQPIWHAIERGLEFSMRLSQPDGRTPEIGGADDGKPIRMEHLPFWDFRPYLAIGAVLFGRGDFKAVAGRFFEDALWLLGPEGLRAFEAVLPAAPSETAVLLPRSGYAVARSRWSSDADYVCFDVGEQAAGMRPDGVPNSMHGHADCLSVVAAIAGRRVLVDSGLYAYNCGGPWESHFRETAAHNTARIDGRDQARHLGKMAWSHSYRPVIEGHQETRGGTWTIGSHDGYARGEAGVTHRRAVWLRDGGYLVVYDEFVGSGAHDLEINWQFAPGSLVLQGPRGVLFDGAVDMIWLGTGAWDASIRTGGDGPEDGWICSSLGVKRPAPRLSLRGRSDASRSGLLTVLASRPGSAARVHETTAGGATLVAVEGSGFVDWVAGAGISDGGPIDTDGLLAVCRLIDGRIDAQEQAGGSSLRCDAGRLTKR